MEAGAGTTRFKPDDRVINAFLPNWLGGEPNEERLAGSFGGLVDGVLSEYCVFPEHALVAFSHLASGRHFGTVVISITDR